MTVATDVYGARLAPLLATAQLVVAPSLYPGMAFLGYMRLTQCVSAGVGVVLEASDDEQEPQEVLARALGGVVTAGYDQLEDAVVAALVGPSGGRLTVRQRRRWEAFRARLWAWNGTYEDMRDLLAPQQYLDVVE